MSSTVVPRAAPALRRVVFDQYWCDLAFLHWPIDVAQAQPFMPPGVRPDTVDGVTYVGLVPFRMRRAGFGARTPVPFFGSFGEVNVRLYSVDEAGRHGVVFRSLDCDRSAVVATARWGFRVPYTYAAVDTSPYPRRPMLASLPRGTRRSYRVRRRYPRPAQASDLQLRLGEPTQATELEHFLTDRWGMHSRFGSRTMFVPNEHEPWPLLEAHVEQFSDSLVAAAGLTPRGPMLRPLWSPGVHARFGPPIVVSRGNSR